MATGKHEPAAGLFGCEIRPAGSTSVLPDPAAGAATEDSCAATFHSCGFRAARRHVAMLDAPAVDDLAKVFARLGNRDVVNGVHCDSLLVLGYDHIGHDPR